MTRLVRTAYSTQTGSELRYHWLSTGFFLTQLCLPLLFLLTSSSPVEAHIEGYNISALAGPGFDNRMHHENVFVPGIAAGYVFPSRLELGLEFVMTGSVPTLGFDINYFVIPFFFVGVQIGLEIDPDWEHFSPNDSFGPVLGFQFGYDYVLSPQFAIGPEIQYLYDFYEHGGIFETLAVVKYYF